MNLKKLTALLFAGVTAATPFATNAQNPTILQGNYISNVFGQANFVLNPNAQTNVANVTLSNATATRSTTTPLVATSEWNVTVTSANGTATWATRSFDAGMKNQNCETRFSYRGFQATSKAQIKQGANVIAELTLTPSATDPRIASINFPCGDLSAATTFVITDSATLSGTNEIGGIYVGLATNQANVAQAEFVGSLTWPIGFNDVDLNTTTYTQFGTLATAPTPLGSVTSPSNAPKITISNMKAGNYRIIFTGGYGCYSSVNVDATCSFRITDGTTVFGSPVLIRTYGAISGVQGSWVPVLEFDFQYTGATTSKTFQLEGIVQPDANTFIRIEKGTNAGLQISAYRFPLSSELVVTPETQNVWGGVKYAGSSDYIQTTGVSDSIVNTTVFGTPSFFGGASVSSSACGLTTNDIGMCLQNVPPGTYEISTNLEFGNRYADGTPGFAICSGHVAVTGSSLTTTKTASALAYSPITNGEDWSQLGTGIVKIDSLQSYLSIVVKVTKTSGAGGCRIRSASSGSSINSHPTITFKPLDNNSNSALYVQGPVKAAETGAAIPAGYVGENIEASGTVNRTSGTATNFADITGMSVTVTPGVWLICAYGTSYFYNAGSGFVGFEHRILNSTDSTQFTIQTQRGKGYGNDDSVSFSMCRAYNATASKTFVTQTKVFIAAGVYTYGSQYATGTISAIRLN